MKCAEEVSDTEAKLTCTECDNSYHLSCSGVSDETYKSKGNVLRKSWRCKTCKTVTRSTQGAKEDKEPNVAAMFASINAKLENLLSLKETVDGIEKSVQAMSDNYDAVLKQVGEQGKEIKQIKRRLEGLEKTDADAEIKRLKHEVNNLEWRNRKQNLEIHGIPMNANEDLLVKVNEVAKMLEVADVTTNEVANIHRLASRPDKTPGIIVRFVHQQTRDKWLEKRALLKKAKSDCYIQENLTKHDRTLLWEAKEWAKETNYRYVWFRSGNVLVRKKDREPVHVIKSLDDLEKLV